MVRRLISYYHPQTGNGDRSQRLFCKYTNYDFLYNNCNKNADLIYCGSISVLDKAVKASKEYNKKLVCWVWDYTGFAWRDWVKNDPIGIQANEFRDESNKVVVKLLQECDLIISASKYTQKTLRRLGLDSEQIYNCIDTEGIDSIPSQVKENQIIQMSRYYYNKRFELSVLATIGLPYKMVCVGFGQEYCRARILGLPNNNMEIYCDAERGDAVRHLKRSKLLVSPSVFEGWGITPVEALYCNIPVLLSDLEVFKEVYGNRVIYHNQDDIEDMENKIKLIMEDENLQKKIVYDCKDVIREFTPKKFAKRLVKLIGI
jgi:glycosyltransferase involved in cell wall biosynthesis